MANVDLAPLERLAPAWVRSVADGEPLAALLGGCGERGGVLLGWLLPAARLSPAAVCWLCWAMRAWNCSTCTLYL